MNDAPSAAHAIPDDVFLALVAAIEDHKGMWASWMDIEDLTGWNPKVIRAKARKLIRRGLMDGCPCGCRGDYETGCRA